MTYEEERKELFHNYLNKHIFSYWRENCNDSLEKRKDYSTGLELIVSSACNTKCTYCYYKNFRDKINPLQLCTKNNILSNLDKVCTWIKKEHFVFKYPNAVEIFSGEFFQLPFYNEILEKLNDTFFTKTLLVIPTNGTFSFSEKKTEEVLNVLKKYRSPKSKLDIKLSLSIDGKYSDNFSRPLRNKLEYTDEVYDRLFKFAAQENCNFHPMICADNIKYWIDNFEWFIEMIQKYFKINRKTAFEKIYLLEVRNPDWTEENLKDLNKFTKYLIDTTFKEYSSAEDYFENFLRNRDLNFFTNVVGIIGRGLGCGLQQHFCIRLSDNKVVPCHRTAYDGFNAADLLIDEEGNLDFKLENPNLFMLVNNFNFRKGPLCNKCPISELCALSCIGCNYEVNKDFFLPVDAVCKMEKVKTYTILNEFYEKGILSEVLYSLKLNPLEGQCLTKANQIYSFINQKIEKELKNE